jgi:hypothetical protein
LTESDDRRWLEDNDKPDSDLGDDDDDESDEKDYSDDDDEDEVN